MQAVQTPKKRAGFKNPMLYLEGDHSLENSWQNGMGEGTEQGLIAAGAPAIRAVEISKSANSE